MTIGFTSYIVPHVINGRNKEVLMVANGRDRCFLGGDYNEAPDGAVHVVINQMRAAGGVDLGEEKFLSLGYVPSNAMDRGQTWWGLSIEPEMKDKITHNWDRSLGKLMILPILGVWAELWQIPDVNRGVPLASYWKSQILPKLSR